MTEIPEHLLKRSRERREALGLSEPGSAAGTAPASTASSAVAPAPSSAPAARPAAVPAPPPPPKPPPPYVAAALRRKRIPWWAMPVLAGLPLWAGVYAFTLEPPSAEADALTLGEEIYTSQGCSSCHGATGGGGTGPAFADGAIGETFGDFNEHMEWVTLGSAGWPEPTYGDADKPVGGVGQMPSFPSLSEEDLALVVRYEREVLGGLEPEPELVALTEGEAAAGGGGEGDAGGETEGGETDAGGGSGGGETTGGG